MKRAKRNVTKELSAKGLLAYMRPYATYQPSNLYRAFNSDYKTIGALLSQLAEDGAVVKKKGPSGTGYSLSESSIEARKLEMSDIELDELEIECKMQYNRVPPPYRGNPLAGHLIGYDASLESFRSVCLSAR